MTFTVARQMIGAEILKVRRNRGVMAFALLLTVGVVVLLYGYVAIQHASNPVQNEPAGGTLGMHRGIRDLGEFFGMLAAVLIGAEVGTADLSSGVFRDLVTTGRSRLALFGVRAAGGGDRHAVPERRRLCPGAGGDVRVRRRDRRRPGSASSCRAPAGSPWPTSWSWPLAVGVGSLTGSRALTLTAVIGWQAIVTNILVNVSSLGSARNALLTPALTQIMPLNVAGDHPVIMATGVAVVVICAWLVIPQLVGAWRTRTRDA